MELLDYVLIAGVGLVAGFVNVLAASGSMLVLPMLIFLGLPASVANATNRVAIILQNVVAVRNFTQQKLISFRLTWPIALSATVGALLGAFVAVEINEKYLEYTIASLLVLMFFLLIFKPSAWIKGKAPEAKGLHMRWQIFIFFFIGLYGGFIQAGVGLFLLAGLVLGVGHELVKANAAKVFIVLIYTPLALAVFIWNDLVNWEAGLVLAAGNMTGAFFASRYAQKIGAGFIRYLLMIVLIASALKMYGVIDWFLELW
ncbi:MAG TPA: sulfite exporter TauE/SafE family protein [Salinivirga sp.]|uniref:sulfite exporter TauE/SafE family protein n=1 Tax=Salinivirga sp. TaxID=1970192 RepID=UPI002B463EFE|nr:sulfite exporter TauE/SafE family protein [Salinivirga sp.]HKK59360.1 sulfite exporter TauE/SafE family protein [Salinivirga sp.]